MNQLIVAALLGAKMRSVVSAFDPIKDGKVFYLKFISDNIRR